MTKDEAMKLALDALEELMPTGSATMHLREKAITALHQALEQPEQVSVPEGWKLVPVEPTDAMLSVPVNIDLRECVTPGGVTGLDAVGLFNAWEAMIEAAPQPWDTSDMAYRPGGLSMEQEGIVPSDYSSQAGDYSSQAGDCLEQEPVAWMRSDGTLLFADGNVFAVGQAFYTAPPKREFVCSTGLCHFDGEWKSNREWQGLTDEEIFDVIRSLCIDNETAEMLIDISMDEYRAIEAKLKEKNN